ncbi:MAG: hypothetical protein M3Q45_15325 [Chloroflexota bacterium]|nr:hypothetical protein [Chloroflexota bacterium]
MTHFRHVYENAPAIIALPAAFRHRRVEIIILPLDEPLSEQVGQAKIEAVDANGWPIGFFEATFGSIPDFPEREAQGEYEIREEFE